MTSKIYSVMCKCWSTVFCACKDVLIPSKSKPSYKDLREWERAEGMNQYTKHKY